MTVFETLLDHEWITWVLPWLQATVMLALGWLAARLMSGVVARAVDERTTPQGTMIARRATYWGILVLALASAMSELGFELSVFLGAAGLFTVAVGFASQTSASNLISGLFLLAERPFVLGDTIEVSGFMGEVVGIDLLSVKLRTFDNRMVRVPNESLLKTEVVNVSAFPIRRLDVPVRVAFDADLDRVAAVLIAAADAHPLALDEPRPAVQFLRYGEHGVELQVTAWAARESFLELRTTLTRVLPAALRREGLYMAVPQLQVTRDPSRGPVPRP